MTNACRRTKRPSRAQASSASRCAFVHLSAVAACRACLKNSFGILLILLSRLPLHGECGAGTITSGCLELFLEASGEGDATKDRSLSLPCELAGAVITCKGDPPAPAVGRDAVADVGDEGALIDAVAVAEGIAIECDVAHHPAGIEGQEQVATPHAIREFERLWCSHRTQRRHAEVVRQLSARAQFHPCMGGSREVANAATHRPDGVPLPSSRRGAAAQTLSPLVNQLDHGLVMQLIVPAKRAVSTDDAVQRVLYFASLGRGPTTPTRNWDVRRTSPVRALYPAEHQRPGVGAVAGNQAPPLSLRGREHQVAESGSEMPFIDGR